MPAPTAAIVWADYNTTGVPSSGAKQMKKTEARAWGAWLESFVTAIGVSGTGIYLTRADLFADLAHDANAGAWVLQDPTTAYNGIYRKIGLSGAGSWSRVADLPYSFISATATGSGTVNAIAAESPIPVSGSTLIILQTSGTNTATPVTVAFNAGLPLTIKTASGANVPVGGLPELTVGVILGSTFRLLSDITSMAIQSAAEDAAAEAQSWAEVALGAVTFNRARAEGTISGVGPYDAGAPIGSPNNIDIKVGGVIFDHDLYTISGNTFTFLTNPGNGQAWESIVHTEVRELGAPSDGTVGTPQLQNEAVTGDILAPGSVDEQHVTVGFLKRLGILDQIVPAMYGAVGDGVADDTAALTSFLTAAVNAIPEVDAILSSGTYRITGALPNLLNPKGRLLGKGRPRIKYDGASAITDLIKLTDASFNRYTQHIENIEIDGGPNAQGLLLLDKVHHAVLSDIYLRNCSPGYQAMKTLFCVLGTFRNIICSFNNEGAFSSAPFNGLIIGAGTTSTTQTIACKFEKLIVEGTVSTGVGLVNSWYNTFDGGTSEGNGGWGFDIKDYSRCNTFINVFCEVNTSGDFNVEGHNNTFINCEGMSPAANSVLVTGDGNKFIGGRYYNFTIAGAAQNTILDGVEILGTYSNSGTGTIRR